MSHPSRRQFLRTAGGLCLALPFLRSVARAEEADPPRRFALFWETGGTLNNRASAEQFAAMHPWNDWRPGGPPEAPALGPLHTDLARHLDRLLFISGVDNHAEPGEHRRADVSSLTARAAVAVGADFTAGGASIDQVLAARLTARWPAPFSSVDLAAPGLHFGEPSYRAAGEPVVREADPRSAFARLFTNIDSGLPIAELARLRARRQSVLDGALAGFAALDARLGEADRRVLEAHQDHLRAIERRLAVLDDPELARVCAPPAMDGAASLGDAARWTLLPGDVRQILAPLQVDLMAQALVCGLTRVVTLHYPDTLEPFLPQPFQAIAPQADAHALGHVGLELGDPEGERARAWRAEIQANRRFKAGLVARFLDQLAPAEDAGGPLLDRTLVLHLAEFSNAAVHSARDLPVMLAGNLGGLATGRHLTVSRGGRGDTVETHADYESDWSVHNLHTAILQLFGFEDEHFGDERCPRRGPLPLG